MDPVIGLNQQSRMLKFESNLESLPGKCFNMVHARRASDAFDVPLIAEFAQVTRSNGRRLRDTHQRIHLSSSYHET